MSVASDELEQYQAGDITLAQLASLWADRDWSAPEDMLTNPKDVWTTEMHAEDKLLGGQGTWDEVVTFWLDGQLTKEDYLFICQFVFDKRGKATDA